MAACDDGATASPSTMAGAGAGTAGVGTAGTPTGTTAGTGTTTGTAGTGVAGTTSTTAGTGAAGSSTAGSTAAGTGAAGMSVAGAGAAGTTPGSTPGFAMCGGAPKTGECKSKAPGIYAMKTEVDVWYMDEINDQPLFDPGRSKITIYFRGTLSDVCEDGSNGKALMHPCGTRLPPLYADANSGVIQIEFPDDLWEKKDIPDYQTVGSTTGFGVGDTLKISKTVGLVGIDLMTPDVAWPSYMQTTTFACAMGTGEKCFPDMDGDAKPGVTVNIKTDGTPPPAPYMSIAPWTYIPAPTGITAALVGDGATKVHIGLRTRLGGSGKIGADCSSGVGSAEAENFESRVISCLTKAGAACSPSEAEFVDQNTPAFHVLQVGQTPPANWKHARPEADMTLDRSPSKGPQSSVVRLADLGATKSCADIRGATFPPIP